MGTERREQDGSNVPGTDNREAAFIVAENTVEELVAACQRDPYWSPTGIMQGERFALMGYRRDWALFFSLGDGDEGLGDHISEIASLTLTAVGRQNASIGMTWGEATELINALTLIVDAALNQAGLLPFAESDALREAHFRISGTTVAELVEFCEAGGSWVRAERWHNATFILDGGRAAGHAGERDTHYRIALSGGHVVPGEGNVISAARPLLLTVGHDQAAVQIPLALGEAVELINAMTGVVAVAMFG